MPTNWPAFISTLEPRAATTGPATDAELSRVEKVVGTAFPSDLRELFLQTNGILDDGYGPVLTLSAFRSAPFVDGRGVAKPAPFPAHNYSVEQYTLLQRKLWRDDAGVSHDTFVVIGTDIGGNPYGFFPAPSGAVCIQSIAHDDGSADPAIYTLEHYLRYYFAECPWFTKKAP